MRKKYFNKSQALTFGFSESANWARRFAQVNVNYIRKIVQTTAWSRNKYCQSDTHDLLSLQLFISNHNVFVDIWNVLIITTSLVNASIPKKRSAPDVTVCSVNVNSLSRLAPCVARPDRCLNSKVSSRIIWADTSKILVNVCGVRLRNIKRFCVCVWIAFVCHWYHEQKQLNMDVSPISTRTIIMQPCLKGGCCNSSTIGYPYMKSTVSDIQWVVMVLQGWEGTRTLTMGLLPDTQNCGLRLLWECRERFPATDFKGNR